MIKPMKQCVLSVSVYRIGDHPVLSDDITKIRLEDDGGGFFFTLEQETGLLRFDFDEFKEITRAVNKLHRKSLLFEKELE